MNHPRTPYAVALRRTSRSGLRLTLTGVVVLGMLILGALQAVAEETIIKSYAYSDFGTVKYPEDFKYLDYVNPEAPKGGEIAIWAEGTFDNFSPISRKGRSGALALTLMVERLMTSTADDAGSDYGLIAESLEYPESKDWVIFNLRPEARFTNGTPVTAEDVKFTFDLLLEQAYVDYRIAISKLVEKAEVLGPHRVKFTFQPDVPRDGLISQMGSNPVMSKAWFEENGMRLDEASLTPIMGTGPYVLDSYDINRRIVYRRDPNYWGNDLPINQGRNNFDNIRVEYFTDNTAALEGFKSGEYTVRIEGSSKTWATGYDFPLVDKGLVKKTELPNGYLPSNTGFVFNLLKEKFQDIRVREAVSLMYNFEWTNQTLQYGLFEQRNSYWQNSDLAAEGVPEGAELELLQSLGDLIDPALLSEPPVVAHTSGKRQLDRRNLRKADALLAAAGWLPGDDGIRRNAAGEILSLEFLTDDAEIERIATPFIANLNAVGIKATLNRVDPSQYTNRERAKDFDMIADGYATNLVPGLGMVQRFGSEDAKDSHFNPASFANKAADILIAKLVSADKREDFQTATKALDRLLRAERLMIPTWYKSNHWVAYFDQYEYPEVLPPYDLGYLDFWWYNAEKAEKLKAAGALR